MAHFDLYQSHAAEPPTMRRWFLVALVLSLALHGALFYYFNNARVGGFVFSENNLIVTKPFNLKRVSLPQPEPEEKKVVLPETPAKAATVAMAEDRPQLEEIHLAPQISEMAKNVFSEKPKADAADLSRMNKADASARQQIDKELNSIAQGLLTDTPRMPRQPTVRVGGGVPAAGSGDANVSVPGLASVDEMLAKTGSLHTGDKAAMPGGTLFEYDQFALAPQAVESMKVLGTIIQKNPRATFSIEGHTDSFGTTEYNQKLSERRAEAVKAWLVTNMGIAPARIQTRGLGNTKPLVSANRSVGEQAPNRRVEIVVRMNRG